MTPAVTPQTLPPFHLAIPVDDLAAARAFYGELLECPEGRSAERWVDFDFFGHQLVVHLHAREAAKHGAGEVGTNAVDGDQVPVPHFGAVLPWERWEALAQRLKDRGTRFRIEPRIRFQGQPGEQATLFLHDPAGNALEFKAFRDPGRLFAR